jgi:TetR/AcrR family transcriptional regulator, hemagglutinin/protease regulatory protein
MSRKKFKRAPQLTPSERKRQLTRCAIEAFAANGIGRANHAQVAALAGVAVPTVFTYFPTREDLVDGVLGEIETALVDIITTELYNPELTAFDKYLNLLSNYTIAMERDPDLVKVFLDWTTCFEQSLSQRFQKYQKKLISLLSEIVEQGRDNNEFETDVDSLDAALMIYSSANILAQIKFFNYDIDLTHYLVALVSSVLHLKADEVARHSKAFSPQKITLSKRESKQRDWQQHIAAWQHGDLTQAQYCEQHGLKLPTFCYWRSRLKSANTNTNVPPVTASGRFRQHARPSH